MNKIRYFLFLSFISCLASCYTEDKLTLDTDSSEMVLRYSFPQGTNSWDDDIVEIQKTYGFYLIYKELRDDDFNRTWLAGHGNTKNMGESLTDDQAEFSVDFFKSHVLNFFPPKLLDRVAPTYIYIGYDVVEYSFDDYYNKEYFDPMATLVDGVDFWSFCLETVSSKQLENLERPLTPQDVFNVRGKFVYVIVDEILKFGKIAVPDEFYTDFNYTTAFVNKIPISGIPDVNHCNVRGFTGELKSFDTKSYSTNLSAISNTSPEKNFYQYVKHTMRFTKEEFLQKYPESKFPKMIKYFDSVVKYLNEDYQWDLNKVSIIPTNV